MHPWTDGWFSLRPTNSPAGTDDFGDVSAPKEWSVPLATHHWQGSFRQCGPPGRAVAEPLCVISFPHDWGTKGVDMAHMSALAAVPLPLGSENGPR